MVGRNLPNRLLNNLLKCMVLQLGDLFILCFFFGNQVLHSGMACCDGSRVDVMDVDKTPTHEPLALEACPGSPSAGCPLPVSGLLSPFHGTAIGMFKGRTNNRAAHPYKWPCGAAHLGAAGCLGKGKKVSL